jgi:hypothetical protein
LASNGTVAGSRIIDIDNQIKRMDVNVQAYRQDLLSRGLPPEQIDAIAQGHFVTEIEIRAPSAETSRGDVAGAAASQTTDLSQHPFRFEMKLLKVELGQQVESGEVLCTLADHRMLLIEGRGFKKDMPLIQDAARKNFPIQVVFEVSEGTEWPPLPTELHISHVANVIDLESRTFGFYLPLENQWQTYAQDGQERLIWRFRPGDRVRLLVAVEQMDNVFALPQAAVVRDGPEAYAFRQNGDLFDRVSIHVLYEDSASIVFANEGRVREGAYFVQNSAASLNRVLKAQLASGQPANVHVHADGTVHTH